jgi:hypothetical protein
MGTQNAAYQMLSRADKEPVDQYDEDYIQALTHDDGMDILEGYFLILLSIWDM